MAVTAKKTATVEPTPAGVFPARCFKVIHFGTIPDTYMGQQKLTNKVRIDWELPTEMHVFDPDKGEQPWSISKDYTVSLGDQANLRKDLESWRGKKFTEEELQGFDITKLIGAPCMINIAHKVSNSSGNTYAYVASISPMPKGMECPPAVNPPFIWDFNENYDEDILEGMHDYFKDKIKSSLEYEAKIDPIDLPEAPMPTEADMPPDDLPF